MLEVLAAMSAGLGTFVAIMAITAPETDWRNWAARIATRWWALNFVRHALVLGAWLAALRTFALFYQQHR